MIRSLFTTAVTAALYPATASWSLLMDLAPSPFDNPVAQRLLDAYADDPTETALEAAA